MSLWAKGRTLKVKSLLFCIFGQSIGTPSEHGIDTWEAIWEVVVWSIHYLFLGVWPRLNWKMEEWPAGSVQAQLAGKPLADGYFVCC